MIRLLVFTEKQATESQPLVLSAPSKKQIAPQGGAEPEPKTENPGTLSQQRSSPATGPVTHSEEERMAQDYDRFIKESPTNTP